LDRHIIYYTWAYVKHSNAKHNDFSTLAYISGGSKDWMHLETCKNFARKCTRLFLHNFQKISGEGLLPPPHPHTFPYFEFLDSPLAYIGNHTMHDKLGFTPRRRV